ncbi:LTXXQ motif family protein [Nitrosospira sp. Nsp11]|uniref:Spy/CpxP family protein refolding chaperone n=1 Tax=Nitrosospira sp. Nsp11 TaxID=1855338 RepID=UPI0009228674|nr:Spy/CpxP family protein refolding chaperone [Nitrosospira sp. Nsp11]SHL37732.1 LTXXQ motif family protein [Nitrosospira sp. Nsp11]
MKTIKKISLIGGLLISSIAVAVPQPDTDSKDGARGCHHGKHAKMMGQGIKGEGRLLDRMADRLELTTEQRSSVKAALEKSKLQMTAIKEKMRTNRKALRELGRDGSDDSRVQALARERGDLVASLVIERSKIRSDIHQILTDTQREQMKQMRWKHRHDGHGHDDKG